MWTKKIIIKFQEVVFEFSYTNPIPFVTMKKTINFLKYFSYLSYTPQSRQGSVVLERLFQKWLNKSVMLTSLSNISVLEDHFPKIKEILKIYIYSIILLSNANASGF